MTPVRTLSPTNWTANGAVAITAGAGYSTVQPPVQVGGQRRGRQTIVVVNNGANSCVLTSSANNDPNTGVTLAAGAVWSLDTEGEVWVSSVAGTTVDVLETWWAPNDGTPRVETNQFAGGFGS